MKSQRGKEKKRKERKKGKGIVFIESRERWWNNSVFGRREESGSYQPTLFELFILWWPASGN